MNHMLDDGPNIARPALRELLPRPCRECGARVASQALRVAARSQARAVAQRKRVLARGRFEAVFGVVVCLQPLRFLCL
jgi:hypothetical protein